MKKIVCFFILLSLASCASQLYVPLVDGRVNSILELKEGRALYVNHCASCHQLYTPNQYTDTEWVVNLNEMQGRGKISDDEKRLIYAYLSNAPK